MTIWIILVLIAYTYNVIYVTYSFAFVSPIEFPFVIIDLVFISIYIIDVYMRVKTTIDK
jgi:hypothetical protein